jgi:hypothetical protein
MKTTLDLSSLATTKNRRPKYSLTAIDIYELYPNKDKVDWKTYNKIIRTFNHLLVMHAIETGEIIKLPLRTGTFGVVKSKTNHKAFNLFHYLRTGEKTYYKNRHSEGYHAKFLWSKKNPYCLLTHKVLYKLSMTRYHKRYLSKKIMEENYISKYFENEEI